MYNVTFVPVLKYRTKNVYRSNNTKLHAFLIRHKMYSRGQTHIVRRLGGSQSGAGQKWPWHTRNWNPSTYPIASQVHEIVSELAYGNWLVCWLLKHFLPLLLLLRLLRLLLLLLLLLTFSIGVRWLFSIRTYLARLCIPQTTDRDL